MRLRRKAKVRFSEILGRNQPGSWIIVTVGIWPDHLGPLRIGNGNVEMTFSFTTIIHICGEHEAL